MNNELFIIPQFSYGRYIARSIFIMLSISAFFGLFFPMATIITLGTLNFGILQIGRMTFRLFGIWSWLICTLFMYVVLFDVDSYFVWIIGFCIGVVLSFGVDAFLEVPPTRPNFLYVLNVIGLAMTVQLGMSYIGTLIGWKKTIVTYLLAMFNGALHVGIIQELKEQNLKRLGYRHICGITLSVRIFANPHACRTNQWNH